MKAWELVEKGWCQHKLAKDADGDACHVRSPAATAFCARGAIARAYNVEPAMWYKGEANEYEKRIADAKFNGSIIQLAIWNNAPERTQAEVVAVLKELDL